MKDRLARLTVFAVAFLTTVMAMLALAFVVLQVNRANLQNSCRIGNQRVDELNARVPADRFFARALGRPDLAASFHLTPRRDCAAIPLIP